MKDTPLNLFGAKKLSIFNPAAREASLLTRKRTPSQGGELRKAAQDFEAIFIAQLLKNMRKGVSESGLFGKGFSGSMYQSMFETTLAREMASKGGLHLSDIIVESLQPSGKASGPETGKTLADYLQHPIRQITGVRVSKNWDRSIISEAARTFELDPKLIEAVIKVESDFNPHLVSRKGAAGLMQLMPKTAGELGVRNRYDPKQNVFGGAKYLRMMLNRFDNDLKLALSAYNAGPAAVEKYGGVPPFRETQNYVAKVLSHYQSL